MTVQEITSSQNPRIKELVRLSSQKKERSLSGLFVVESAKLVEEEPLPASALRRSTAPMKPPKNMLHTSPR